MSIWITVYVPKQTGHPMHNQTGARIIRHLHRTSGPLRLGPLCPKSRPNRWCRKNRTEGVQ